MFREQQLDELGIPVHGMATLDDEPALPDPEPEEPLDDFELDELVETDDASGALKLRAAARRRDDDEDDDFFDDFDDEEDEEEDEDFFDDDFDEEEEEEEEFDDFVIDEDE